jgi:hypothetical protein
MATINLPGRHVQGLIKLFSLPDEYTDQLIESLSNSNLTINPENLIKDSLASITGFTSDDVNSITQAIISLLLLRGSYDNISAEELVVDFVEAIKESDFNELKPSDDNYDKVQNKLVGIFSIENLLVSAKAVSLKFECENLFTRARIVTEILPVFVNIDDTPKAAIISHQLSIHYFQDGRHREFYLAIDEEEIDDLMEVLERAKRKGASLQKFLDSTNVKYIENK